MKKHHNESVQRCKKNHCLKEVTNKKNGLIEFRTFCPDHKPNDSFHRIFSQFVPEVWQKKTKINKMIEKEQVDLSIKMNAEWLLQYPTFGHTTNKNTGNFGWKAGSIVEKNSLTQNKATPNILNVVCQSESDSTKIKVDSKKSVVERWQRKKQRRPD